MVAAYICLFHDESRNLDSLRQEITDCAACRGDSIDRWVVDRGGRSQCGISGSLLQGMGKGDTVYIDDMSRLGSTFESILQFIYTTVSHGIHVHGVRNGFSTDCIGDVGTYLSAIEQLGDLYGSLISNRTKKALQRRRAEGKALGRPVGTAVKMSVLHGNRSEIERKIKEGVSLVGICSEYGVSYSTLRRYLQEYVRPSVTVRGTKADNQ